MRSKALFIVLAVLVLGVSLFFFLKKSSRPEVLNPELTQNPTPTPESNIQTTTQNGTFMNFLRFVVPQSCTFSSMSQTEPFSGTIYLDNGRVYSKISVTRSDVTIVTNLIFTNSASYTWIENSDTGFKLSYRPKSQPLTWGEIPIDPNAPIQYLCQPWQVDESYLTPSKAIKYSDFSQYIRPTILPSGNTTKCGACDSLGDISKQVCLISLNCK